MGYGNVFLQGENVQVSSSPLLKSDACQWRVMNYEGEVVTEGSLSQEASTSLQLNHLPVGYYRIESLNAEKQQVGWTSLAVLPRWKGKASPDSPVCVDAAIAWFARDDIEKQKRFAQLVELAGVSWVRDRMNWGELETEWVQFAEGTTYDTSAQAQSEQGLQVLQVFHSTPKWAWNETLDGENPGKRFPRDLRHLYHFCKKVSLMYKGQIQAWEPWNEANIEPFGGHPIDEMCSLQKAAYWGLKMGVPDIVACWNVFAGAGNPLQTEGILLNEVWPYFDTYNIHSYAGFETYEKQFDTAREAACGKPLWITECGIRLPAETEGPWGELSPEDERRQSLFVAKSYSSSLWAGVDKHFFFILGNYLERGVQFGLLRHDLTPRPGYLALVAVGRLLNGAVCVGRTTSEEPKGFTCIAFEGTPFGEKGDVLLMWSQEEGEWKRPQGIEIKTAYDHLGRTLDLHKRKKICVNEAPIFLVLEKGDALKIPLSPRRTVSPPRQGKACPVVMQTLFPSESKRLHNQGYMVDKEGEMQLALYHFGDSQVSGLLEVEALPQGWSFEILKRKVSLHPGDSLHPEDRLIVPCTFQLPDTDRNAVVGDWIKLRGKFGDEGDAVLAFRLCLRQDALQPSQSWDLPAGNHAIRWRDNIVEGSEMSHEPHPDGGVVFRMDFKKGDPWAYPILDLQEEERPSGAVDGLRFTCQVLEGRGTVRVQFVEATGSHYVSDTTIHSAKNTLQTAVTLLNEAQWGAFSNPDETQKLEAESIQAVMIGINASQGEQVSLWVKDLAWVKF